MKVISEKTMLNGLLILGFFCTVYGEPASDNVHEDYPMQGDDDYQYDDENVSPHPKIAPADVPKSTVPPYVTITEYKKKVHPGENAVLDCPVKNLAENNVVLWKNHTMGLAQSNSATNPRVSIDKNYTLTILNVSEWDSHTYICQILPQLLEVHAKLQVIPFATNLKRNGAEEVNNNGSHLSMNTITFLISFLTLPIGIQKLLLRRI